MTKKVYIIGPCGLEMVKYEKFVLVSNKISFAEFQSIEASQDLNWGCRVEDADQGAQHLKVYLPLQKNWLLSFIHCPYCFGIL